MSNSAMIDQKGRLKIPATLLPALKGSSTEFFITSEGGSSVRIYPRLVWNQVEERLEHLCAHNGNNQKLLVRAKYFGQVVAMEPCPIPEKSETQSNYGADEKMLSKLSSAPRFPGQYAGTKRNGMSREQKCDSGYSAECVRIHAVKRAKPLPGHRTLGTRQNAPIQILYPQRGQKTVSQSVFAQ